MSALDGSKRARSDSPADAGRTTPQQPRVEGGRSPSEEVVDSASPTALSGAAKKTTELSEECCVRLGVFLPSTGQTAIGREEFVDEMDAIHMTSEVERIEVEPLSNDEIEGKFQWAKIYFNTPSNADLAASELNIPLRNSKWRQTITQRLPLKGAQCGEINTIPAFIPFECNPPDTIVVDTQEGFIAFATDEVYHSAGALDFMEAKRNGRLIRRLVCKHFDAHRRIPCRFGASCTYMHIKAVAADRLLRTVSHKTPLRVSKQDKEVEVSSWDFERRYDTLVIRQPTTENDLTEESIRYMFENCPGFVSAQLFSCREGGRNRNGEGSQSYGLVRFDTKENALSTLLQTYNTDLNIGFYGVMEDVRKVQVVEGRKDGSLHINESRNFQHNSRGGGPFSNNGDFSRGGRGGDRGGRGGIRGGRGGGDDFRGGRGAVAPRGGASIGGLRVNDGPVPFPALTSEWGYGVSRRTGQYYFFQHGSKAPTTWKHPVTGEKYNTSTTSS